MHAATMKDKGKSAKGWSETSCLPFNSKYFKYYHLKEKRKQSLLISTEILYAYFSVFNSVSNRSSKKMN